MVISVPREHTASIVDFEEVRKKLQTVTNRKPIIQIPTAVKTSKLAQTNERLLSLSLVLALSSNKAIKICPMKKAWNSNIMEIITAPITLTEQQKNIGLVRDLNPGPLAP